MGFVSDDSVIEKYILLNKRILKIAGLYPVSLMKYFLYLFCLLLLVIPEVIKIYENSRNLDIILETSSVLLTLTSTIFKFTLWIYQHKNENLIKFLFNNYWNIIISLNEFKCIGEHVQIAKKLMLSYAFLISNSLSIFYFLPIRHVFFNMFKESKVINNNDNNIININFPFPGSYPKFCYESPYFEIVYISQIISTSVCALIVIGIDTIVGTAIFYACGHFMSIKKNFEKLNFQSNVNKQLIQLIKHHKIALRFSQQIEEAFNVMILFQVISSSLLICLVGFQTNSALSQNDKSMKYFSYLLMALFQLILFCWPGDKLINNSFIISHTAYSANWYESNSIIKNEIMILILRAQKPCYLTAGKFQTMSLESFSAILSSSLSYFMLLKHFDSD